ncbi:MAG: glycoside hydrolase family 88 protein [Verrucomicrobia bacterium]|nr:glycoside hydrolase family 88 protein [Verrucomicrobiota bacterium]
MKTKQAHPEFVVVTKWGPEHPLLLSFVSQLLEHGVFFEQGPGQGLLSQLPDDLTSCRAIVLDTPSFAEAIADAGARKRLDAFARAGGFVQLLDDPTKQHSAEVGFARQLFDQLNFAIVCDILAHTRASRFGADALRSQLDRPDREILDDLAANEIRAVEKMNRWHEMTQHHWKALKALIEVGGRSDLRDLFIAAVRKNSKEIPPALNHDMLGGYFAIVWLHEQTGDHGPLEKARTRLDEVLSRRPRQMGLLTSAGFEDDPLGLADSSAATKEQRYSHYYGNYYTTNPRTILCNEGLHFYGSAYGAFARATGEHKYYDEALRHVEHIHRYHQRPDGLIAHGSREGQSNNIVWSRGLLHALIGLLYLLEEMDRKDPAFARMLEMIRAAGLGLIKHQDERTGLWRNVIDHPDARLEASGTAGFCYVFARCIREGWLDRATFAPMVRKAWQGVKLMYWRGGLGGNCRGSGLAYDLTYYLGRPQGWANTSPSPWALMALLEVQRL